MTSIAALVTASGGALNAHATQGDPTLPLVDVVVVSGGRIERSSFDLPAAIDAIVGARIRDAQLRVNLSEVLATIPGIIVKNRQNYAQDLQVSSRGFGARSAFGVRGVRLIADGIPASMPDGQGQAATFNLDVAQRIEVLRGPLSAVHGNHAGGMVQLFTLEGQGNPVLEVSYAGGSDGERKLDLNAHGAAGGIGYVLDTSRFETDGYRHHSAARRDQRFAKLTLAPTTGGKLTLVASGLDQDGTQDPLGVSWASWLRNPRAGEIDANDTNIPKRSLAERYDTRKSIHHQQTGLAFDQRLGNDRLHLMVYGGNRDVVQYQSFSKAFQAAASHSGGVVQFDRNFHGADLHWVSVRELGVGTLTTTAGIEYGYSNDDRKGYENFIGNQLGVIGKLRRDEQDELTSTDPYLQAEWQGGPWVLTAGLRHSRLQVEVQDNYLSNGNDGGTVSYSNTTPLAGLLYKLSPHLHAYASAAHGLEAPTLNELFYSSGGSGFNYHLAAARSVHLEAGVKAYARDATRMNAALFQVRTNDELVVDTSSGGRTSYRNASKTLRQGIELSLDSDLGAGLAARVAVTTLRAVYSQGSDKVAKGSRLPGVANANLYAELAWKDAASRFGAAIETIASGRVYAEDSNMEIPAPGYAVINIRLQAKQESGAWQYKQFVRLNNLAGRQYIGSVIVGDANKRYYEAAPGRNWQLGASVRYQF